MKIVTLLLCLYVAVSSFASVANAQCIDYAGCLGDIVESSARLKEYQRATAEVAATERAVIREATAQARAMRATEDALNMTATVLARPTQTPRPTITQTPTVTQLPTVTPYPIQTVTQMPTVQPTPTPVAPARNTGEWSTFRWVATLVGLPICAIMFFWAIARFRKVI